MLIHSDKLERAETRRIRRERGVCLVCEGERTINADGKPSMYCDDCRVGYVTRTKRTLTVAKQRDSHPSVQYDAEGEPLPLTERTEWKAAKLVIRRFIKNAGQTTIGKISNKFPQYQGDILESVLMHLKDDGECDYDEHKPLPTKVYARPMNRVRIIRHTDNQKRPSFNNNGGLNQRRTPMPDGAALYGKNWVNA